MSPRDQTPEEKCATLEKRLEETRQECAYYKAMAEESGRKRLKDIHHLTKLISDYKRAEEKIRVLLSAVEQSIDGIALADLSPAFYYVNASFARMHGYEPSEMNGMAPGLLHGREGGHGIKDHFGHILSEGSWSGEAEHRKKDGTMFPVYVSSTLLKDENGQPTAILSVTRDITEQKRLENRLQHAHKMEAMGILAGGVAHDLNNILAGLIAYPEILLMELPDDSPLRSPLMTVKKSGLKAAAIVKDLLTLSRRGISNTKVTDINRIVADYIESPEYLTLKAYHPDVKITSNLQTDLPLICGSPIHLHKVLMNLVSNGAQSMPRGGRLIIRTEERVIHEKMGGHEDIFPGHYVVLVISDTGEGIAPENVEKIFEPFYTKRALGRSGTGLGMSVVWATVKDHNGFIDIQSELGNGTVFLIYLPVTDQSPVEEPLPLPMESYFGKGESVLVVDDVREQRELACVMLRKLGYKVNAVGGGEEALAFLKGQSTDLVLLDMIMAPHMDGLETYKRILEFHPGQKAVIVSGFAETEPIREAQRLGAGPYVKKPYSLEEIGIAVRGELKKKQGLKSLD